MPRPYIIHGGKPEQEAILDQLWTGLRDRIDSLTAKPKSLINDNTGTDTQEQPRDTSV